MAPVIAVMAMVSPPTVEVRGAIIGVRSPIVRRRSPKVWGGCYCPAAPKERDGIGDNALPSAAVVMMVSAMSIGWSRADHSKPCYGGGDDCDSLHDFSSSLSFIQLALMMPA